MNAVHDFKSKVDRAIDAVKDREFAGAGATASLGLIGVGLALAVAGFAVGGKEIFWSSWLVATIYWILVSMGGVMFGVIMQGTRAHWGRPLKRVGESFAFYLPVMWLALAVFTLGGGLGIYEWNPGVFESIVPEAVALEPHGAEAWVAKPVWLTTGFFTARQLLIGGLLFALALFFVRNSLRPDLIAAKNRLGDGASGFVYTFAGVSGKGDVSATYKRSDKKNEIMIPVMGFGYAIIMSMFAFDLIMSLDAWWFSNMFGGWVFMTGLLLGLVGIAVITIGGIDWLSLHDFVEEEPDARPGQAHPRGHHVLGLHALRPAPADLVHERARGDELPARPHVPARVGLARQDGGCAVLRRRPSPSCSRAASRR